MTPFSMYEHDGIAPYLCCRDLNSLQEILLVYSKRFTNGKELAVRDTFADIGATVAANFDVKMPVYGKSILGEIE